MIRHPARKRSGELSPLKVGDSWVCVDCRKAIEQNMVNGKKRRPALRCNDCGKQRRFFMSHLSGSQMAARAVAIERHAGRLLPASSFACADCGRPAECYDHRDYGKPLAVDPVCRSCNVVRGPAKPLNPFIVAMVLMANLPIGQPA